MRHGGRLRKFADIILLSCLGLCALRGSAAAADGLLVQIGQQKSLQLQKELRRVAVDNPDVVDVRSFGEELLLVGHAAGETTVAVWFEADQLIRIQVVVVPEGSERATRSASSASRVAVLQGGQTSITVPSSIVAVEHPKENIADVRLIGPKELLVLGVGEGQGAFSVWSRDGKQRTYVIDVKRRDPERLLAQTRSAIEGITGVTAIRKGDAVYVEGCPQTREGTRRLKLALLRHPGVLYLDICCNAQAKARGPELEVGLGTQQDLMTPGTIQRTEVDDKAIVDVRVLATNELLVLGVKEGKTTLTVFTREGESLRYPIRVYERAKEETEEDLRMLRGEDIQFQFIDGGLHISGRPASPEETERFNKILNLAPEVVPADGGATR